MTKRLILIMAAVVASIAGLVGGFRYYVASLYPFGPSHCCDKQLIFALEQYATEHGKCYPAGEATPEGSLSLLYPQYADANLLRGKSVPEAIVRGILEKGERLGPDTCGWHYVEGLRSDDNPDLALFWDKEGLDHNGRRLPNGGHIVWFVHFRSEGIPAENWDDFLAEQKRLLAEVAVKRAKENEAKPADQEP